MLRLKAVEEELEQKKVISGQDNLLGFKKVKDFLKIRRSWLRSTGRRGEDLRRQLGGLIGTSGFPASIL